MELLETKKKYQKYLGILDNKNNIYKPHHTMKKSVYDLDGERINAYDAAIERLFSIVMSAPTNRLSRSPAFQTVLLEIHRRKHGLL